MIPWSLTTLYANKNHHNYRVTYSNPGEGVIVTLGPLVPIHTVYHKYFARVLLPPASGSVRSSVSPGLLWAMRRFKAAGTLGPSAAGVVEGGAGVSAVGFGG